MFNIVKAVIGFWTLTTSVMVTKITEVLNEPRL